MTRAHFVTASHPLLLDELVGQEMRGEIRT